MSSGRSSHEEACFSVDFTKYLMLSKSMPVRSLPQVGIGFLPNSRSAFIRVRSIQSGSFLRPAMSATTSSDRPRRLPRHIRVGPAVVVRAEPLELRVPGFDVAGGHQLVPPDVVTVCWAESFVGTWVVQTCSP